MENVLLKNAAKISIPVDSLNSPLSFLEWKQQVQSIPDTDLSFHYNQYILNWFNTHQNQPVSQKFLLRQKYLYLLQQLQTFFTEDEKNNWYNQINFSDERELLLAIPYFAKKLRDVAIYYLDLRKRLKYTKLKYNRVGTKTALEHEICSYLLNALAPSKKEFVPQLLSAFPTFPEIQQSLVVTVDELYDDNQYFDRSPTAPLSSYVNVLDQATTSFFQTKGLVLSSDEWIFKSFDFPLSADINSFVNRLTGNVFEQSDVNLYGSFIQEFLGEDKYTVTLQNALTSYYVSNFTVSAGDNSFYFPSGVVNPSYSIGGLLAPVALSSITFAGASSGTTLSSSDSIFVKSGNVTKGAWYRYIDYDYDSTAVMSSHIAHNDITTFIFPYPGYGLSAQDAPWTGASVSYSEEFPYLTPALKASVLQSYWSSSLSAHSCLDVLLNNTTLADSGATPSKNFSLADKIYLRTRDSSFNTNNPHGTLSGAWLYAFTKTAIPVSIVNPTVILWPYDILDTTSTTLSSAVQNFNFTGICKSTPLQDINTSFFIAGSSIDYADKIYKLRYFTDDTSKALECAWLSGGVISSPSYNYVAQDGLTMHLSAGTITRFVWTGSDNTPLSSVFTYINHQQDCPLASTYTLDWTQCTCKQTHYSPFGHPGINFTDFNAQADFIALDVLNDLGSFDLGSWKDANENGITTSPSFAWYSTINNSLSTTWGYGQWTSLTPTAKTDPVTKQTSYTPNASTMVLRSGQSYFYGRTNARLTNTNFPPYVVLNKFNTNNTTWIGARYNAAKSAWVSTDVPSQFNLNPGDFITFSKQVSTTNFYVSAQPFPINSTNQGSIWATYDSIALSDNSLLNQTVITWPDQADNTPNNQYPPITLVDLLATTITNVSASDYPYLPTYFPVNASVPTTTPYPTTVISNAQTLSAEFPYSPGNAISYFVVPPHVTSIYFEIVGGGGGGGSGVCTSEFYGGTGGGGGAGQLKQGNIPVTPGETIKFTIGAGGVGSSNTPYSSTTVANNITKSSNGVNGKPTTLIAKSGTYTAAGGIGGGGAWVSASSTVKGALIGNAGAGGLNGDGSQSGQSGTSINPSVLFPIYGGQGGTTPTATYPFTTDGIGQGGAGADAVGGSYTDGSDGSGGGIIIYYTIPSIIQTNTPTVYSTNTPTPNPTFTPNANNVGVGGVLRWNIVNAQTSATQAFYNQNSITFTPSITGTYYIEVTAQTGTGERLCIYGQSSPNKGNGIPTIIPDLTAVPGTYYANTNVSFGYPAAGFLIEEPLKGWSYATNSVQSHPYDVSAGARPFWAQVFNDKDANTNFKGVLASGTSNEYVDDYIPRHIPRLSPLSLTYNAVIEYERKGPSIWWTQPFTFKTFNGTSQWCVLSSETGTSNLSSVYDSEHPEYFRKTLTFATTSPSDIVLTNNMDGTPVSMNYYAINNFTWSVSSLSAITSVAAISSLYYQSQASSSNLSNRFYTTIATVPTLEKLYSTQDVGGYFLPQNLGASQFINANYAVTLQTDGLSAGNAYVVEDTSKHIGGRGLTKQDQPSVYSWSENNLWLKEPATAGALAGLVKKSLTKTNQVFVPYQPNGAENLVGLVNSQSRITPWGGPESDIWTDLNNKPQSFTGVLNLSAWTESQELKQSGNTMDSWVTDIHGNQYGVYKNLAGLSIADRLTTPGQLWTRNNNGLVQPGYISLSSVYSFVDSSLYSELTDNVLDVDCFSDVLMIHTPSVLLFTKIGYDYATSEINALFDNTRGFFGFPSSNILSNTNRFEQTWFLPQQKQLIVLMTNITDVTFNPTLFKLDLNTLEFTQIFPLLSADVANMNNAFAALGNNVTNGTLTYNKELKTYLATYTGIRSFTNEPFFVNIEITNWDLPTIQNIDVYTNTRGYNSPNSSPLIVDANDNLTIGVSANTSFSRTVPVLYFSADSAVDLLGSNVLTAVIDQTNITFQSLGISTPGIYQIPFALTNTTGTTNYSFCVTVVS